MSTLIIDTIQGKTSAGSVNVRAEGSNNTNLQQGLAKYFIQYAQATDTVNKSLNSSCLLYTSPSPRDKRQSRMPSSA